MRRLHKAFTLVELLVVISIIGLLVAILMPALGKVRTGAKVAALKATFHSMTMGLEQFRNDFGSYPSSAPQEALDEYGNFQGGAVDTGAHLLVQSLAGLDLLGYEGSSLGGYYATDAGGRPIGPSGELLERKGPYVPIENIDLVNFRTVNDPVKAYEEVGFSGISDLENNINPIFVDNFKNNRRRPILYYKANKRGTTISTYPLSDVTPIYEYSDNGLITDSYQMDNLDTINDPPIEKEDLKHLPYFLWDRNTGVGVPANALVSGTARPYNRDSFILWSAGPDGEFGTEDDVTNFERK